MFIARKAEIFQADGIHHQIEIQIHTKVKRANGNCISKHLIFNFLEITDFLSKNNNNVLEFVS